MTITIVTPQFDRVDNKVVLARPQGVDQFLALKKMSLQELKTLGCGVWTETELCYHMLYPKEWYDSIPNGLDIFYIDDTVEAFEHGKTDDDTRFGMLAFGFLVAKDVK